MNKISGKILFIHKIVSIFFKTGENCIAIFKGLMSEKRKKSYKKII
jgi:hypothetical protein